MLAAAAATCLALLSVATFTSAAAAANQQQEQQQDLSLRQNVSEEMHLITKSLEDLLSELSIIKQEANGRLSSVKNRASTSDQERIRQTKVSRFVLKRVAELESESLSMRDELSKIFALQKVAAKPSTLRGQAKQEDDFDSDNNQVLAAPSTTTTTVQPQEEAAKIGFDVEALKKLGEEIGKRLDQFGKDAAKNLGDLIEGVKLVFREPAAKTPPDSKRRDKLSEGSSGGHSDGGNGSSTSTTTTTTTTTFTTTTGTPEPVTTDFSAAAATVPEGGVAEAIIGRALLRVLEAVIGLADRLELGLAVLAPGVLVRMVFHRELAIRRFDRRRVRGPLALEQLVIVDLGHATPPRPSPSPRPRPGSSAARGLVCGAGYRPAPV